MVSPPEVFCPSLILASVFLFYTYFWKTSYDVDRQLSYEFAKNYFTKSSERLTTRGGIIWRPMGRLQAIATATSRPPAPIAIIPIPPPVGV